MMVGFVKEYAMVGDTILDTASETVSLRAPGMDPMTKFPNIHSKDSSKDVDSGSVSRHNH